MEKMQSERIKNIPSPNSLLKISIGLIIVAIISSAFVYAETASVTVDGTTHDVEYTGDGVSITGIEADLDGTSLIISVDTIGSPGTLDVTFDRNFFDSTYLGNDDDFFVLIDADEATFSETQTSAQSRTLSITVPDGTEEIEIIGTVFGTDAVEEPDVTTEPDVTDEPDVTTEPDVVEKEIPASFVDSSKDPKSYVQRYLNEPSYKAWFEENFSDYTFYEALGISKTQYDDIVKELTASEKPSVEEKRPHTCTGSGDTGRGKPSVRLRGS